MNRLDLIIDALSVAQNSVWSALTEEALAAARELKAELTVSYNKPIQVRPAEFAATVSAGVGADFVGTPMIWAEWPTPKSATVKWSIPVDPNNFGEPLAQPEQEPVAWRCTAPPCKCFDASYAKHCAYGYTAPPKPEPKSISTNDHLCAMLRQVHDVLACTALPMKRKWQGLTNEEVQEIAKQLVDDAAYCSTHFAIAIEAELRRKNNAV